MTNAKRLAFASLLFLHLFLAHKVKVELCTDGFGAEFIDPVVLDAKAEEIVWLLYKLSQRE